MSSWLLELRVAFRSLRSNPTYSGIAILALALGIGANVAIFSVIDGVYFHRLPYRDPGTLVMIWEDQGAVGGTVRSPTAPATLRDWQHRTDASPGAPLVGIAALRNESRELSGLDRPLVPLTHLVTDNYFDLLGVDAALGRTFRPGEGVAGGLVVISHGLWRTALGGDPAVVGRRLELSGEPHTIVGVLPASFYSHHLFPTQPDLWIPTDFAAELADPRASRSARSVVAYGRLAPGTTVADAGSFLASIAADLARQHPETNGGWSTRVEPLRENAVGDLRSTFLLLMTAVGVVLLIACVNVANLALARAVDRGREVAMRTALGADGWRISRLLLTEGLLLALVGGGAGVLLALALARPLRLLIPPGASVPFVEHIAVDGTVLLFALALSFATSLLFGLAPARRALRIDLASALRGTGGRSGGRRGAAGELLIVAEVALAVVLVIAAGLTAQSLIGLRVHDPGFEPEGLFTWRTSVRDPAGAGLDSVAAYFEEAERRVAAVPGVDAVGSISFLPPQNPQFVQPFTTPAYPPGAGDEPRTILRAVTSGYFGTLEIETLAGRGFDGRDTRESAPVAVINRALAERYFGGLDPLGRTLTLDIDRAAGEPPPRTIVGVVDNVLTTGSQPEPSPITYVPLPQSRFAVMNVVIRTRLDPVELADDTERAIWSIGGDQNVYGFQTLEQAIADSQWRTSFSAVLLGSFALLALLLGAAGIYAVLSHSVNRRTAEMGLRIALGASARDVLGLVLAAGLRPVMAGVLLGMAGAAALSQLLSGLLFEVRPVDPATYLAVGAILTVAALVATWMPARRATRVDPIRALRAE